MVTNRTFQIHICTTCCAFAATSFGGSDFIWVQRKQLKWGRTAVQAERPSSVGFCVGECRHHMHSNSSIRCLVFPDRICLRVLYLSRPARMLSAWMMSFAVFLLSSRALASSELKAWKEGYKYYKITVNMCNSLCDVMVFYPCSCTEQWVT